jgi:hypothetical protein
VREESHLDDMRAAIRGDFDRLAKRRGGQELMQAPPEPEEPETVEPEAGDRGDDAPRRGFLARLLGR